MAQTKKQEDDGRTLKIFINSKNDKPLWEQKRTESPRYQGGADDLSTTVTFKDKDRDENKT